MRRKSVRNSGKSSEKSKQPDTPVRKSKRNSKRRRKSTTSESENTEDEKDLNRGNCSEERIKNQSSDVENDNVSEKVLTIKEDTLGKPPEVTTEKKIKLRRTKATANQDEDDISDKSSRRSRRRGSPKVEESTSKEEAEDEEEEDKEDKIGKGKSKGKHKSKIDKSQLQSESENHTESEISENVQVTPQSPQTNIDNPVDKEPINVESESIVEKTQIEEECSEVIESVKENTADTNSLEDTSSVNVTKPQNELQESTEESTNQCLNKADEPNTSVIITPEPEDNTKGDDHIEDNLARSPIHIPQNDLIEINENKTEEPVEEKAEKQDECREDMSKDDINAEDSRNDDNFDLQKAKTTDSDDSKNNVIDQHFEKSENNLTLLSTSVEIKMDTSESQSHNDEGKKNLMAETSETHLNENGNSNENSMDQSSLMEVEKNTKGDATQDTSELSMQILKVDEKQKLQKQKIVISRNSYSQEVAAIVKRRKKWGNSAVGLDLISPTLVHLDINTIQTICPSIQLLEESEVKLEIAIRDRRKSSHDQRERKKSERKVSLGDSDHPLYESQISENSMKSDDNLEHEIDNSNIIAMNRKISIVDDSASKLKPPPSPAKNSVSEVLYITNLVRPFTLKQLKELLERTGKIKENGFWTDRIKSKCYVQYESVNEAESTRNALHGVHWPIGNGKKLIIDYAIPEDLDNARNPPPPVVLPPPPPQQPAVTPEVMRNDKENQEPPKKVKQEEEQKIREKEKEKRRHEHVREWDVGKEELHRGRSRSQDRHARHKRRHSRNTPSPVDDFISRKNKKLEEQIPQKLMDDLFQKTKSTPSIYWQPLTPEEIATKQQQRLERMAEHKRRMEETSRNRADFGRGGPYRRRYD